MKATYAAVQQGKAMTELAERVGEITAEPLATAAQVAAINERLDRIEAALSRAFAPPQVAAQPVRGRAT